MIQAAHQLQGRHNHQHQRTAAQAQARRLSADADIRQRQQCHRCGKHSRCQRRSFFIDKVHLQQHQHIADRVERVAHAEHAEGVQHPLRHTDVHHAQQLRADGDEQQAADDLHGGKVVHAPADGSDHHVSGPIHAIRASARQLCQVAVIAAVKIRFKHGDEVHHRRDGTEVRHNSREIIRGRAGKEPLQARALRRKEPRQPEMAQQTNFHQQTDRRQ